MLGHGYIADCVLIVVQLHLSTSLMSDLARHWGKNEW